ncbi:hypothetical protein BDK51DRAFT_48945 [Blyttiomyces helicus]|uniref:Uncharacterized protein n=1 Tax=Blyttiomyces helicus TaxID=388810 RepID=A0A4P9W714_9FUNG|nr:hypothetical protein BDK51DRAFT_48945 [Blyttiomyces helicus]|eukprot:RKO87165.1 hypothetical protein BDK51DRAFT_48945 [Blyttiomyces helicus]
MQRVLEAAKERKHELSGAVRRQQRHLREIEAKLQKDIEKINKQNAQLEVQLQNPLPVFPCPSPPYPAASLAVRDALASSHSIDPDTRSHISEDYTADFDLIEPPAPAALAQEARTSEDAPLPKVPVEPSAHDAIDEEEGLKAGVSSASASVSTGKAAQDAHILGPVGIVDERMSEDIDLSSFGGPASEELPAIPADHERRALADDKQELTPELGQLQGPLEEEIQLSSLDGEASAGSVAIDQITLGPPEGNASEENAAVVIKVVQAVPTPLNSIEVPFNEEARLVEEPQSVEEAQSVEEDIDVPSIDSAVDEASPAPEAALSLQVNPATATSVADLPQNAEILSASDAAVEEDIAVSSFGTVSSHRSDKLEPDAVNKQMEVESPSVHDNTLGVGLDNPPSKLEAPAVEDYDYSSFNEMTSESPVDGDLDLEADVDVAAASTASLAADRPSVGEFASDVSSLAADNLGIDNRSDIINREAALTQAPIALASPAFDALEADLAVEAEIVDNGLSIGEKPEKVSDISSSHLHSDEISPEVQPHVQTVDEPVPALIPVAPERPPFEAEEVRLPEAEIAMVLPAGPLTEQRDAIASIEVITDVSALAKGPAPLLEAGPPASPLAEWTSAARDVEAAPSAVSTASSIKEDLTSDSDSINLQEPVTLDEDPQPSLVSAPGTGPDASLMQITRSRSPPASALYNASPIPLSQTPIVDIVPALETTVQGSRDVGANVDTNFDDSSENLKPEAGRSAFSTAIANAAAASWRRRSSAQPAPAGGLAQAPQYRSDLAGPDVKASEDHQTEETEPPGPVLDAAIMNSLLDNLIDDSIVGKRGMFSVFFCFPLLLHSRGLVAN